MSTQRRVRHGGNVTAESARAFLERERDREIVESESTTGYAVACTIKAMAKHVLEKWDADDGKG